MLAHCSHRRVLVKNTTRVRNNGTLNGVRVYMYEKVIYPLFHVSDGLTVSVFTSLSTNVCSRRDACVINYGCQPQTSMQIQQSIRAGPVSMRERGEKRGVTYPDLL